MEKAGFGCRQQKGCKGSLAKKETVNNDGKSWQKEWDMCHVLVIQH